MLAPWEGVKRGSFAEVFAVVDDVLNRPDALWRSRKQLGCSRLLRSRHPTMMLRTNMRHRSLDSGRQLSDIKHVRLNPLELHHICMIQKGIQCAPRHDFFVWGESRSDLTKKQPFCPHTRIFIEQPRACALVLQASCYRFFSMFTVASS